MSQNKTHGTLWSTVASVQSGLRTGRPAVRLYQRGERRSNGKAGYEQALECLRTGDFVDEMTRYPVSAMHVDPFCSTYRSM